MFVSKKEKNEVDDYMSAPSVAPKTILAIAWHVCTGNLHIITDRVIMQRYVSLSLVPIRVMIIVFPSGSLPSVGSGGFVTFRCDRMDPNLLS